MKPLLVNILLLASLIVSIVLFHLKFRNKTTDFDRLLKSLTALNATLPENTTLLIKNRSSSAEVTYQAINILAPHPARWSAEFETDTALYITEHDTGAMNAVATDTSQRIVWRNQDDRFNYFLTVKK